MPELQPGRGRGQSRSAAKPDDFGVHERQQKRSANQFADRFLFYREGLAVHPLSIGNFPAFRRSFAPAGYPRVTRGVLLKAATFRS